MQLVYLSDAWIAALDDALRTGGARTGGAHASIAAPVWIEVTVRAVPGRGDVRYHVGIDADGAHAAPGPIGGGAGDDDHDTDDGGIDGGGIDGGDTDGGGIDRHALHLHTDYATAVALTRGETNAQSALARGALRVGGDVRVLLEHGSAVAAWHDAAAALRARTDFVAAPGDRADVG